MRHAIACGLLALAAVATPAFSTPGADDERALKHRLGERGVAILEAADRVEALRVQGIRHDLPAKGPYKLLRKGPDRDAKFGARLSGVLLGDGVTAGGTRCPFSPGVAFRAYRGEDAVEVVICFGCDDLMAGVLGTGKRGRFPYPKYGFKPARAALVGLAKEAFPDDEAIRDLPEERKE